MIVKYLNESASFDELGTIEQEIGELSSEILRIEREAFDIMHKSYSNYHLLPDSDAEKAKDLDKRIDNLQQKIWDIKNQYEEYDSVYDRYSVADKELEAKLAPELDAAKAELKEVEKEVASYRIAMRDSSAKAADKLRVDQDIEGKKAAKQTKQARYAELINQLAKINDLDWVAPEIKDYINSDLRDYYDASVETKYVNRDADNNIALTVAIQCKAKFDDIEDYVDYDEVSVPDSYFEKLVENFIENFVPDFYLYHDDNEYLFSCELLSSDVSDDTRMKYHHSPATMYNANGDPGDPDMSEFDIWGDITLKIEFRIKVKSVEKV